MRAEIGVAPTTSSRGRFSVEIVAAEGGAVYLWRLPQQWQDAHVLASVRSVRRGGKVVQETVTQLGELDAEGRAKARSLACQLTGRRISASLRGRRGRRCSGRRAGRSRAAERGRSFGGAWLGWTPGALGLDRLCEELLPEGREAVPKPVTGAVLVLAGAP
jgi:hypothetical protein